MKKEYDFSKGKKGPVLKSESHKVRITIRLDNDIIDFFKKQTVRSGGGNYQSLINAALRNHIGKYGVSLNEDTLRRVIKEELASAGIVPSH